MRRITKLLIAILMMLLLCCMLAGCTGQHEEAEEMASEIPKSPEEGTEISIPAEPGVVRIALGEPISTLDVHLNTADYMLPLNIYERLFDICVNEDGSTDLTKGLAEDWSVSEDGLTYRFTLRDDAFFSDGTPVTASDVAFTFTRMLSLPESRQTDFADMILGADAVMSGVTKDLRGIRVLDDKNLEITLSEPFSGYLYQLATPSCSIMSEEFVKKAGNEYGKSLAQTLGSGPYRLTEYSDTRITVEKNPYYHCHEGEELTVSRAEFLILPPAITDRMFRAGELDLLDTNQINPEVVEAVYKQPEWDDHRISYSRVEVQYLMLNVAAPPLNNAKIRKAVQMAINRQRILDELYDGDGRLLDGIFPRGLIGYSEKNQGWLKYDPEEAASLIDSVLGAKDVRLELAANSQSEIRTLRMLEMIREDLSKVGLNVSIVTYDDESRMYLRREGRLMAYSLYRRMERGL